MAITQLPYKSLKDLLDTQPIVEEDPKTLKLINRLSHVLETRELSRGEFLDICYWKSARSIRRCERNSAIKIETTSHKVFATTSEKRKLELLTSLYGVNVPTASAILTITNPKDYGVIDMRVWHLLYALGSVKTNPSGIGFSFSHWYKYLQILRYHAKRLEVQARLVELTMFAFHKEHQIGTLYK